jgi:hypothetical protein
LARLLFVQGMTDFGFFSHAISLLTRDFESVTLRSRRVGGGRGEMEDFFQRSMAWSGGGVRQYPVAVDEEAGISLC